MNFASIFMEKESRHMEQNWNQNTLIIYDLIRN